MAKKYVYSFEEGSASQRDLLGGKGDRFGRTDKHRSTQCPRGSPLRPKHAQIITHAAKKFQMRSKNKFLVPQKA